MTHCSECGAPLILLQDSLRRVGLAALSDRTGEILGCRVCDITHIFGSTRLDEAEHWMKTPFKCSDFSRARLDWDAAWQETENN